MKPEESINGLQKLAHLRFLKLKISIQKTSIISTHDTLGWHLQEDQARAVITSLVKTFTARPGNAIEVVKITFRTSFYRGGHTKWTFTVRLQPSGPPLFRVQKKVFWPLKPDLFDPFG